MVSQVTPGDGVVISASVTVCVTVMVRIVREGEVMSAGHMVVVSGTPKIPFVGTLGDAQLACCAWATASSYSFA